jgi:hypothetical protein
MTRLDDCIGEALNRLLNWIEHISQGRIQSKFGSSFASPLDAVGAAIGLDVQTGVCL